MNIFDENNKLDCSKTNNKYCAVLGLLWQLLSDCDLLIKDGKTESAKDIFSKGIQNLFPSKIPNLDSLETSNLFYGDEADNFSDIYLSLVETWKSVQEEWISDLNGDYVDPHRFKESLNTNLQILEKILHGTVI